MVTVRYFWHGFIHRGTVQHLCTFNIVAPLFITFSQIFRRRRTPSVRSFLLMFRIDRPIERISVNFFCCTGSLAVVLSLWWRDRNLMDSYRVSIADVPEFPIAIGARGPWQLHRCDSLRCYEEWWGFVPPSVAVFSWVHVITIFYPNWKNHCEEPSTTQEMNLSML